MFRNLFMGNASVTSAAHEKVEIMSHNMTSGLGPGHTIVKEKLTAEQLRKRGNEFHDVRRFQEAIDCYTKAITKDPSVATYYTNRALCFLRLQRWDAVCKDCNTAIERDPSCLKAHYFMGVAIMEKNNYDEALNFLHKANELALKQRQCFGDEITSMIRVCRKRRWMRQEEKRMQQEIDLQVYIHRLIEEEKNRQIDHLLANGVGESVVASSSGADSGSSSTSSVSTTYTIPSVAATEEGLPLPLIPAWEGDVKLSPNVDDISSVVPVPVEKVKDVGKMSLLPAYADVNMEKRIMELQKFHDDKKVELDRLLAEVDERRKKRDVPDYLCGKISFEMMNDPVITPSGITYDRKDIDEHLRRVGHFDPVTRAELTHDHLIPNLAMKEVVDHFLSLNEWAIDY